ncbi:hypothetical protein GCM10010193_29440 [Kitasatospora atroaurantiaca]|uniref:Secreted protein n=1 Tax=Kitasatospora atroaurantiaca TaxID=285545 RepID=A0A561EIQ6_9ACTN|nr:hypothetical protein [Kitasatospora atroaurantiaca]TWE15506.1 hypothetical protein FB465_0405 [Kitasatospora atroaurantiaca]
MSPDTNSPTPSTDPNLSRRRLMSGAAATGAVGLLSLGAASAQAAPLPRAPRRPEQPPVLDEPMVVHLRDVRTGELDLFTGHTHQRVRNPELAAALVRALG